MAIVSVLIILGAFSIKIFKPDFLMKNPINSNLSLNSREEVVIDDKNVSLPVDINDKGVISAGITYTFEGKVTGLTESPVGTEITLDIDISGLPTFIVTPSTIIQYFDKKNVSRASLADLKEGQTIRLTSVYGLKIRNWYLSRISILVNKLPNATPSN